MPGSSLIRVLATFSSQRFVFTLLWGLRASTCSQKGERWDFNGLSSPLDTSHYCGLPQLQSDRPLCVTTKSVCTAPARREPSVLLQSFDQQVVEAGDHRPGVVVQTCRDHGVVVDLQWENYVWVKGWCHSVAKTEILPAFIIYIHIFKAIHEEILLFWAWI